MTRALRTLLVSLAAALALAGTAQASGGNYVFDGGSPAARTQVRAALNASDFDWSLVRRQITITISACGCGGAKPGQIDLDEDTLVNSPFGKRYAWGIVQHEYAHQVGWFLLSKTEQTGLTKKLGGSDWCYEIAGLDHSEHACERFATTFAWAYAPKSWNNQGPDSNGESAAMAPAAFRTLMARMIGPRAR